jgi:hypothetical protein
VCVKVCKLDGKDKRGEGIKKKKKGKEKSMLPYLEANLD